MEAVYKELNRVRLELAAAQKDLTDARQIIDEENKDHIEQMAELRAENAALKERVHRLEALEKSTWQRGHAVGINGLNSAIKDMSSAKESYLDENQRLTELLLSTEDKLITLQSKSAALADALEFVNKQLYATVNMPLETERYFLVRSVMCEALAAFKEKS